MLPGHEASHVSAPPTPSATNDAPVESKSARIVDAPRQFLLRLFVSKQQRIELSFRRGIPRRPRPNGSASAVKLNQYGAKRMHEIESYRTQFRGMVPTASRASSIIASRRLVNELLVLLRRPAMLRRDRGTPELSLAHSRQLLIQ